MSLWGRVYTERRAVVLPLMLFLAANLAVLILGVLPLRQSVVRATADAADARNGLAAAMVEQRQARTARTSTDNAGTELGTFYSDILPSSVRAADALMFWLEGQVARASGVQLRGGTGDYDDVTDSELIKVVNRAVLLGRYEDVLRFLHAVEIAPQFVIIEKVELSQTSASQPAAGELLELGIDVATYFKPEPGVAGALVGGGR